MSIHKKIGNELVEFASHVAYNNDTAKLTINKIEYQLPKIEVVDALPANPDSNTIYFVTGS